MPIEDILVDAVNVNKGDLRDYLKNREIINVKDFGAIGDGSADDTDAIIDAAEEADAAGSGSVLYLPYTPGATFYKISDSIPIPKKNGIVICGSGRRASRIRQVTSGKDVFSSDNVWATATNGIVVRDLWLEGANGARQGLRWIATNRSQILNCRFSGFTGTDGAGIYTEDSLLVDVHGCDFDGNKDGILENGGANTGPNGWNIQGNLFENQTQYGLNLYQASGIMFAGNCVESNALGGYRHHTAGSGITISGNYFEQNLTPTGGGVYFDIHIGEASAVSGVVIEGNYFNGRVLSETADYYPIRAGLGAGWRVGQNAVNVGNRFMKYNSSSLSDSTVEQQGYGSAFVATDDQTVYGTIPANFINARNKLKDDFVIPSSATNLINVGVLTAFTETGSGTWLAGSNDHLGRATAEMVASGAFSIAKSWTIGAVSNNYLRNKWVMFLVDAYTSDATSKNWNMNLDNGTSGSSLLFAQTAADGWKTWAVIHRVGNAYTTLRAQIVANSNPSTLIVANPRVVVGLDADLAIGGM